MRYTYLCSLSLFILVCNTAFFSVFAQDMPPKREFRGVWIANVVNVDWPSAKGLKKPLQKAELLKFYDLCQANNFNVVIVQVRPASDALYRSKTEVWSEWLTGEQGKKPGYDPLKFMVKEAHKRGLEFHAWFNPYRAIFNEKSSVAERHVSRQRPEWLVRYGKGWILDPGLPEVRDYVADVIEDVVRRYDIDGVHFDDYFYPYPIENQPFPDSATFQRYGQGFASLADWRRDNVDQLIRDISARILTHKPYVKFGVSPFGVWRNRTDDPTGSATRAGAPTYDLLYADTRKWLQEKWVDYMMPQIYWSMDLPAAPFRVLTPWWAENHFGRHIYIGHGAYKVAANSDSAWHRSGEISRQVRLVRTFPEQIQGSAYFSAKSLLNNPLAVRDSLHAHFYQRPALLPLMPWKPAVAPNAPRKVRTKITANGVRVRWKRPRTSGGGATAAYALYRFSEQTEQIDFSQTPCFQVLSKKQRRYFDPTGTASSRYYVSALDRLHTESPPVRQR